MGEGLSPGDSWTTARNLSSVARSPSSNLKPGAFLHRVAGGLTRKYSGPGTDFHAAPRSYLAKFWFGLDGSIHYEAWVHERTAQLELGFHCESAPEYNAILYTAFDQCLLEIQASLGDAFWLEEWDRGWIRLYETHPLWPLDEGRVEEVVERLAEIIATVQPIYDATAAEYPPPPPPPEFRRAGPTRRR